MPALLTGLPADESGVTAIEYGLIAALIAVVCARTTTSVANSLS